MTIKNTIQVLAENLGTARIDPNPPGSLELVSKLLQANHDDFNIFFRDIGGHNHTVHALLTILALGGGPADLQRAYEDDSLQQKPFPAVDDEVVRLLGDDGEFLSRIGHQQHYGNFLRHFEGVIEAKGWRAVVDEYCFSRSKVAEAMFPQLFDGAYHPLIHLGFGVEFELPQIVAEALAQVACHVPADTEAYFVRSEQLAASGSVPSKPLLALFDEVRAHEKIQTAARLPQGPLRVREGVMVRAREEIAAVAAHYQVLPEDLELGVAEMISCAAYCAGAAQRRGKARKIDFFYMHNVTSSIFLSVLARQDWISLESKVRLLEWKGRMDLVWYAACSAPELRLEYVAEYQPTLSWGLGWRDLYKVVTTSHDDGHVAKFIRALKNGEDAERSLRQGPGGNARLPVRGDMWLKIAQMAYDTTAGLPDEAKWIMGTGFDPLWAAIPDLPKA